MSLPQRLIATAVLLSLSGVLAGHTTSLGNWDPPDFLDFPDPKKKLPGERKPVFPDGVPGMDQGVPKDMYKGAQQQDDPSTQVATAPPPPPPSQQQQQTRLEPPPGSPAALKKLKSKQQATAAAQPAPEADGETAAASQDDG